MSKYFKNVKSFGILKSQYKELLKANHPDNGGDLEVMKEINVEYDALFPIWKNRQEVETKTTINETASSTRRQFYTDFGWEGSRYNGNMTTTEIAKTIRLYCKEKYPTWKFSVTTEYFSGGSSIDISVMEAPEQIFDLEACRKAYVEYTEFKETYGYYGSRGLAINIDKMFAEDKMHWQLHSVRDRDKEYFTEYGFSVIEDVYNFMQSYNFDDSDSMIDYFHCNFYESFNIGKWNKGFKVIPKTARIKNKATKPAKSNSSSPAHENVPETANTALSGNKTGYTYKITKGEDSRDGSELWLVRIVETLDKEAYIAESKAMQECGGYYSKFKHRFIFRFDPTEILAGEKVA